MNKKIIIPTILFIIVLIFSFVVLLQKKNKIQLKINEPIIQHEKQQIKQNPIEQNPIILFYSDECPHCVIVEDYIEQNKIEDKISFIQKEVYYNEINAKELEEKAKLCGISADSIGVPLLWDDKKCLVGDQDIINFFKQKSIK